MSRNKVEITVGIKDAASAGAKQAIDSTAQAAIKANTAVGKSAEQASKTSILASRRLQSEEQKAIKFRTLGVRSEQQIRRDMLRTEMEYRKVVMSQHWSDQPRISMQKQQQLTVRLKSDMERLNAELAKSRQQSGLGDDLSKASIHAQRIQKSFTAIKASAAIIGGGIAAYKTVVAPEVKKINDFDLQGRGVANILANGGDVATRYRKLDEVKQVATTASRLGGKRTENMEAISILAQQGDLTEKDIFGTAPTVAMMHTASGTSHEDLAKMGGSLITFGVKVDNLRDAFGKALVSGDQGSFELSDMAQHMPKMLATAGSQGYSEKDLPFLFTLMQSSRKVTGTGGEAATATTSFLADINTEQVKKQMRAAGVKNVTNEYTKGAAAGENTAETTLRLIEQIKAKDKNLIKLQQRLATVKNDDEKAAIIQQQMKYIEGGQLGKIFRNDQSRIGLLGYLNNGNFKDQQAAVAAANSASIDAPYQFMAEANANKAARLENEQEIAKEGALKGLADTIGDVDQKLTDYAQEYPRLAVAISGTTTALKFLAMWATVAGTAHMLMSGGGKGILSKIPGLGGAARGGVPAASTGGIAGAGSAGAGAAGAGGGWSVFGSSMMAAAPLAAMWGVKEWAGDTSHDKERVESLKNTSGGLSRLLESIGIESIDTRATRLRNQQQAKLAGYEGSDAVEQWQRAKGTRSLADLESKNFYIPEKSMISGINDHFGRGKSQQSVTQNVPDTQAISQMTQSAATQQTAAADMQAAAAIFQAAASKIPPNIPVTVTVENGNIVAYVNDAEARTMSRGG